MKQIGRSLKLTLLFFLLLLGCEKGNVLPDATQEGLGTFGMLVNGEIWKPYSPLSIVAPPPVYIQYSTKTQLLEIKAKNTKKNEALTLFVEKVNSTGYYNLSYRNNSKAQDSTCHSCIACIDSTRFQDNNGCEESFKLKDSINSLIQITKFDTLRKIISGKFSLKLESKNYKSITISEGRFDVQYD